MACVFEPAPIFESPLMAPDAVSGVGALANSVSDSGGVVVPTSTAACSANLLAMTKNSMRVGTRKGTE